ncbi:hypothetical protein NLG97_g7412 [Lecanicillium saksenae]|uniref:Uncharacterized protein n=1 Tax=Lecanicillium saksenae TaxID=468837 RepID=A0ACC1QLX4_9HYPO|nr:hypothetical protein NLG97_g7412 [Lecanicillium saksenae]
MTLAGSIPSQPADVCIHAGDLTEESKLEEFHSSLELLRTIKAPLKLVIAGNHDFTLDTPMFKKKIQEIKPPLEPELVQKFYGEYEEARKLLLDAKDDGIHLLNEGTHSFVLKNGAELRVYASPYTPSLGDWGFQYHPNQGHEFSIEGGTDIVVTHGPPRGILDRTDNRERAGCPELFAAVAQAKPQIHCFGHIHEGWGVKMVAWRSKLSEKPSFLADIDNAASELVEQLSTIRKTKFDTPEEERRKKEKLEAFREHKYCGTSFSPGDIGSKTLFVNASIKGDVESALQLPWLVDIVLPRSERQEHEEDAESRESAKTPSRKRNLEADIDEVDSERAARRLRSSDGKTSRPNSPRDESSCSLPDLAGVKK